MGSAVLVAEITTSSVVMTGTSWADSSAAAGLRMRHAAKRQQNGMMEEPLMPRLRL
jgi:hypothetical protein